MPFLFGCLNCFLYLCVYERARCRHKERIGETCIFVSMKEQDADIRNELEKLWTEPSSIRKFVSELLAENERLHTIIKALQLEIQALREKEQQRQHDDKKKPPKDSQGTETHKEPSQEERQEVWRTAWTQGLYVGMGVRAGYNHRAYTVLLSALW